ncbi:hypothetical protein ACFS5M_12735 [Lacinutrix iliipiscaria]|uniref:Uncharacterized protein n=1 Tax=Lacinutrix iliipiscaria TaxID=1230532 RepID=A0ABW5WSY0_9FLAO
MKFKATNKQILRDEITFQHIKEVLDNLNINTLHKFKNAKNQKIIRIPGNIDLNKLCIEKTGKSFKDFFEFKRSKTKPRIEDKLLEPKFIADLKKWCTENSIESINQYVNANVPSRFPSAERIRQVYGYEYFADVIGIHARNYEFMTLVEARKKCLENGVIASQHYSKFYQEYNKTSELKLPSDPFRYYKTNWSDFIQLSDTQLFIGNGMSSLELFTYKLLYDRNIKFEMQKTFDDCRSKNPLPFDFYLPQINTIIELDGKQHDSQDKNNLYYSEHTQKHDRIKNKYCKDKKIRLIRIKGLLKIKQTLEKEINLNNYKKTKDLDWTSDFNNPTQVLESELSKSIKIKLLLLMCEKGRCNFTNQKIIKEVGCFKSLFYAIKNELINLSLINRETDYYIDEKQENKVLELFRKGIGIEKIKELSKVSRSDKIIEIIEKNGLKYTSKRKTKENSNQIKKQIIELYLKERSNGEISNTLKIRPSYCSQIITDYKIKNGIIKPSKEINKIIENIIELELKGFNKSQICDELKINRPFLYKCLKFKKASVQQRV